MTRRTKPRSWGTLGKIDTGVEPDDRWIPVSAQYSLFIQHAKMKVDEPFHPSFARFTQQEMS